MIWTIKRIPALESDLTNIALHVASHAGYDAALRRVLQFQQEIETLADRPRRGAPRDDILDGLRVLVVKDAGVVCYRLDEAIDEVIVLAAYFRGRDWGADILARGD